MANIAYLKNGLVNYEESVDPTPFLVDPTATEGNIVPKDGVVLNPDKTFVASVPMRYWKIVGNTLSEMTADEKAVVDANEAAVIETRIQNLESITPITLAKALVNAGVVTRVRLVNEIKKLM